MKEKKKKNIFNYLERVIIRKEFFYNNLKTRTSIELKQKNEKETIFGRKSGK